MNGMCRVGRIAMAGAMFIPIINWGQVLSAPPAVRQGVVRNYMYQPFSKAQPATLYARNVSSSPTNTIAKAASFDLITAQDIAVNYKLLLPLATAENSAGAVTLGTSIRIDVDDGSRIWGNVTNFTVNSANAMTLNLLLGSAIDENGISAEYKAFMQQYMLIYGIAGAYDPNADYNHDGITNLQHYQNGTDPFGGTVPDTPSATNTLSILSFNTVRQTPGDQSVQLNFMAVQGVSYYVLYLDSLAKSWVDDALLEMEYSVSDGTQIAGGCYVPTTTGPVTLTIPVQIQSPARFYKLYSE